MKKIKIISLVISIILILEIFPQFVFANGENGGNFKFNNIAPVTSFEPQRINKKNVDVVLITDYTGSQLNNVKDKINNISIENKNEISLNLTTVDKDFLSTVDVGTQQAQYERRRYGWFYEYYYKITNGFREHYNRGGMLTEHNEYSYNSIHSTIYHYRYHYGEYEYKYEEEKNEANKGETGKVVMKSIYLNPGERVPNDRFIPDTKYEKSEEEYSYSSSYGERYVYYFPKAKTQFKITKYTEAAYFSIHNDDFTTPRITYNNRYKYIDSSFEDCTNNVKTLDFTEFNSKVKVQENSDVYVIFALKNSETNFYNSDIYNQNCKNNLILGTMRNDNVGKFIKDNKATVYSCCSDTINNINLSSSSYKVSYKNNSQKQNVTINTLINSYATLGIKNTYDKIIDSLKNAILPPQSENLDIIVASDKDQSFIDNFTNNIENNISTDINCNISQFNKNNASTISTISKPYIDIDNTKIYTVKSYNGQILSYYILDKQGNLFVYGNNSNGELGVGSTDNVVTIKKVMTNVKDLYINRSEMRYYTYSSRGYRSHAYYITTCFAFKNDNTVWVAGANAGDLFQNNDDRKNDNITSFKKIDFLTNVKQIYLTYTNSKIISARKDGHTRWYSKVSREDATLYVLKNDNKLYGMGINFKYYSDISYSPLYMIDENSDNWKISNLTYMLSNVEEINRSNSNYKPHIYVKLKNGDKLYKGVSKRSSGYSITHKFSNTSYFPTLEKQYNKILEKKDVAWDSNKKIINQYKIIGYKYRDEYKYKFIEIDTDGNIYRRKEFYPYGENDYELINIGNLNEYLEKQEIHIKAINTQGIMNVQLNKNSERYFIFFTDNYSNDIMGSSYYPFGNLNANFIKYLNDNKFNIYTVCPNEALNFKLDCIKNPLQNRTINDMLNNCNQDSYNFKTTTQLSSIIIKKYKNYKTKLTKEGYIIVEEDTLDYTTNYQDYENDLQYKSNWIFVHDPHIFENNSGLASFSGKQLDKPINTFTKTGRYYVSYIAQDNPYDNDNFSNYRRWSKKARTIINVHHRPTALCSIKKNGTSLDVYDYSYDLDHVSENEKGIVERSWKWRYADETSFRIGYLPTTIQDKHVIVRLKVKDIEGAWSHTYEAATFNNANIAPVASFTLDKYQMSKGKENNINDFSYDPDNDPITKHWYLLNQYNTIIKDCGSNKPNLSTLDLGKYKLKIVVTDDPTGRDALLKPLSNECIQEFEVKNMEINHKPIANFEVMPNPQLVNKQLDYIDKSYDPDTWDNIILYQWSYSLDNGVTWTAPTDNPQQIFTTAGKYLIRLRVQDVGNEEYPALWSDYCIKELNILPYNTRPNAAFEVSPNPQLVGEELKYSDNANSNDSWDRIVESLYSYSADNQKTWSEWTTEPPTSFDIEGDYIIRRKVKDRGNVLSTGLWSYIYTRKVTILPRNTKPTAEFTVNPNPQYIGEELTYIDNSKANDDWDSIVQHEWSYTLDGETWTASTSQPPTKFNDLVEVEIRHRVKDKGNILSPGMWSEYCYRKVNIVCKENNRPLANFSIPSKVLEDENINYTNSSHEGRNPLTGEYDRNWGDMLTEQKWSYCKQGSNWTSEVNTPPNSFSTYGTYYIGLRVKDKGNKQYAAMWSDYCTRRLEVFPINHKPIAEFTINPLIQVINESVAFSDLSKDNDTWDELTEWEWSYRKEGEANFKVWSTDKMPSDLTFSEKGIYEIRLKVRDKGNELSSPQWSDYCIKEVKIIDLKLTAELTPNPARQGQMITITAVTDGYAKDLTIYFPIEIASLDPDVPLYKKITEEAHHVEYIEYFLPIDTQMTIDREGFRLRQPYTITVKATKDGIERTVDLLLDIKGNIYDGIKTEIRG